MQTLQKPKGFSFDRILQDPMAMFGSLGVMGALVVTVWVVAARTSGPKEDEVGASFQKDATVAAAKAVAPAASHLGVAKLKNPAARSAADEKGMDLKDAGAASLENDGRLTGTIAEIEARQKSADAKKEKPEPKQNIPTEVAGQAHVPGMAPDSTALAASGNGGFGQTANLSNPEFAAGGGVGAGAPAGGAKPVLDGRSARVASVEGGPLVARAPGGAGKLANFGTQSSRRAQSGGGSGPSSVGDSPRAALAAAGAGAGGAPSGMGGAMPEFSGSGATGRGAGGGPGGQESASWGGGGDRMPSAGGGAPSAAGLGGMGSGRGVQSQDSAASASAGASKDKQTSAAPKKEISDQAANHLKVANEYNTGVVIPLVNREKQHGIKLQANLVQASGVLSSLDAYLKVKAGAFPGTPDAAAAINDSRQLISQGPDSLLSRVDSASVDAALGVARVTRVPKNCDFNPVIQVSVPGFPGAKMSKQVDLHGVATKAQDQLEGAARRASNVHQQAGAGISMVGPTFDPVIAGMPAGSAPQQNLIIVRDRISGDLQKVSTLLPDEVNETVGSAAAQSQGGLTSAATTGAVNISGLSDKVNGRMLAYPDGPNRDALTRDMADAVRNSRDALGQVNSLRGTSSDTMFVLAGAARFSTYAEVDLCESYTHLKALEGAAK